MILNILCVNQGEIATLTTLYMCKEVRQDKGQRMLEVPEPIGLF